MTATIALTEATLPHGKGAGSRTNKILTDGHRFYCGGDPDAGTPCPDNYSADTFGSVFSHRSGQHGQRRARNAAKREAAQPVEQALASIRKRAEALMADVDSISTVTPNGDDKMVPAEWKERALKAERSLKSMRRALGV